MASFVITGFSDEIDADFSVQLEEVNKLNIDFIEIRGVNGRNVADYSLEEMKVIKGQLDEAGIQVSAIGSPIGKIDIEADFGPHFDLFKHVVALAKIVETSYIRLFSFFVKEGQAHRYREEVMARMSLMVRYAESQDMILLHENEKGIYGDTAERCLDLFTTMKSDNLRLIFDPANFVQCGVETYSHGWHMLKDHVTYMHIKDALLENGSVVPSGYGDGHLKEIIEDLKKRGYEGFLSLEPHLGDFVGFNDLEGENKVPEFQEASNPKKFRLAYDALMKLL